MHHTDKKESKKENEKKYGPENLLQGDSNPDPPTLKLKMKASIHWTILVSAYSGLGLKELHNTSLW